MNSLQQAVRAPFLSPLLLQALPQHYKSSVFRAPQIGQIKQNALQYRRYSLLPNLSIKESYIHLIEQPRKEKEEETLLRLLDRSIMGFGLQKMDANIETKWGELQNYLEQHFSYHLPNVNTDNLSTAILDLLNLFRRPLLMRDGFHQNYDLVDYVCNPTEFFWHFAPVESPFETEGKNLNDFSSVEELFRKSNIRLDLSSMPDIDQKVCRFSLLNGDKDSTAAILLAAGHIDEGTLVHEMGCNNGRTLMNLLMYNEVRGKKPKYCIGTDINPRALAVAEDSLGLLSLKEPILQLHLSNALSIPDVEYLHSDINKEIRIALRLLPVLNPADAKTFFRKTRNSHKKGY